MSEQFIPDTIELYKLSKFFQGIFPRDSVSYTKVDDCSLLVTDKQGGTLKASYKNDQVIFNDGVGMQPTIIKKANGDLQQIDWHEPYAEPLAP